MKITDVQTILVANVPPYRGGRVWLFVKLYTDDGLVGIGESTVAPANLWEKKCVGLPTQTWDVQNTWRTRSSAPRGGKQWNGTCPNKNGPICASLPPSRPSTPLCP